MHILQVGKGLDLPSVLIIASSIPFAAIVVAAPMRKLWVQYLAWSIPALAKVPLTALENL